MTMPISLMRTALRDYYRDAHNAHPGLLLQRGYREHESGNADNLTKTQHIKRLCGISASPFYINAYQRWVAATADHNRFGGAVMQVEGRLFIGLSGSGMLETGCAIHHSYGVPYIPGSSIKGVVSHFVRHQIGMKGEVADCLFGADADPDTGYPDGLAGCVVFHDGWWVPDSADKPLVEEIVTSHHTEYYGHEGAVPALDSDSPIPNAQIAVQGAFLITFEIALGWQPLVLDMLEQALGQQGVGAKTRAGYGRLMLNEAGHKNWSQQRQKLQQQQQAQRDRVNQAAELARQQAAFAALSVEQQALKQLEQYFKDYQSPTQALDRSALIGKLNHLLQEAAGWQDADNRNQAAALLEQIYGAVGWGDPGLKKDKREKQERKRRDAIAALRGDG